mgnify:CR=1 FL=1
MSAYALIKSLSLKVHISYLLEFIDNTKVNYVHMWWGKFLMHSLNDGMMMEYLSIE